MMEFHNKFIIESHQVFFSKKKNLLLLTLVTIGSQKKKKTWQTNMDSPDSFYFFVVNQSMNFSSSSSLAFSILTEKKKKMTNWMYVDHAIDFILFYFSIDDDDPVYCYSFGLLLTNYYLDYCRNLLINMSKIVFSSRILSIHDWNYW